VYPPKGKVNIATQNAINLRDQGLAYYNGAGLFSAPSLSQHYVVIGAANNNVSALAPSATSGVALISQGSSADPVFGTVVVAGGGTGATSFTAYAPVLAGTTSTGAFQSASTGLSTAGYVLTSNGDSAVPSFQAVPVADIPWSVVSGATQSLANDNGYISNAASGGVAYTLPATSPVGSIIEISGLAGGSGWSVTTGAQQTIQYGSIVTADSTAGALSSTGNTDSIRMVCAVANSTWVVLSSVGNLSYID
jgi:hypothetical protein